MIFCNLFALVQGEIDTLDNLLDTSRPPLKKKWEYELYRISMEQKVYQVKSYVVLYHGVVFVFCRDSVLYTGCKDTRIDTIDRGSINLLIEIP